MNPFFRYLPEFTTAAGLCAAALLLLGCPMPLAPNVALERDVVYGQGYVQQRNDIVLRDLVMDVYTPTDVSPGALPAVVMMHGGGFDGGRKDNENLVAQANILASSGYVVFSIAYRLEEDAPPAPPPFDSISIGRAVHAAYVDAKTALRHVRANAATYGIDPQRIAALGESAGAIAMIGAGITESERFLSDGEGFPVPEVNNPTEDPRPQLVVNLWGGASFVFQSFDPTDPPMLIVHGQRDLTAFASILDALAIIEACEENGIPFTAELLPGRGHGPWDATIDGQGLGLYVRDWLDLKL